ncbi:MAG: glycosyltransferase family 2 protein [Planctomyces sp.]|nr:glycosyltransferase family 2 protein [Planctomyces sp.]
MTNAGPLPLSVAIVCKDGARTIARTLDAVRPIAAEILALDSGSTDGTLDMLARAGARVVPTEWLGHVRTKQRALEACSQPWVLCLDADESPEPDLIEAIAGALAWPAAEQLATAPEPVAFALNRKVWYAGRFLNHAWQPEWRTRLVRGRDVAAGLAAWAGTDPHDALRTAAAPRRLRGTLRHDSFATFAEQLGKQVRYAGIQAGHMARRGDRGSLASLLISPPGAFLKQLVLKAAWRDGWAGWLAAACAAQQALCKHAALIELGRAEQRPDAGGAAAHPDNT